MTYLHDESCDKPYASSRYDRTAWFYERAAHLYSGGKILESKRWQLRDVKEGDELLYVGAGSGEDVILAAKKGARVTVVELAPKMLARMKVKLESLDLSDSVTLICGDAFDHDKVSHYDLVAANYFLNVFSFEIMCQMLKHLTSLVKPGGQLMVADFAPVRGNFLQAWIHRFYYYSAVSAFHLIAKNPFHKIYDYTRYSQVLGLSLHQQAEFRVLPGQSAWYQSLAFQKNS